MSPILIYTSTGIVLFCLGLSGLFLCNHPFRKILSMNFSGSGIFLILVAFARRQGGMSADPVPDALVLTGIVVAISATAVALALYRRMETFSGDHSPDKDHSLHAPQR